MKNKTINQKTVFETKLKPSISAVRRLSVLLIFAAMILTGCAEKTDKYGFYDDFDAAMNAAQKKNKVIFLAITTSDFEENNSAAFLSNVLKTEKFMEYAKDSFVCVNLDFSEEKYMKAYPEDNSSEPLSGSKQKEVDKFRKKYERDMMFANIYAAEEVPVALLLTKEGYVLDELNCDSSIIKPEDFISLIESDREMIEKNKALHAKVNEGSAQEKLAAIDDLYDSTPIKYRTLLENMINQFLELDKNNETGKKGKYVVAKANVDGQHAMLQGDLEGAVSALGGIISSDYTSNDEKQQAYFITVQLLMQTNSSDVDRMLDLMQKAYECNTESELAAQIQIFMMMLNSAKENMAAPQTQDAQDVPTEMQLLEK